MNPSTGDHDNDCPPYRRGATNAHGEIYGYTVEELLANWNKALAEGH